jgi:hypothetical protein
VAYASGDGATKGSPRPLAARLAEGGGEVHLRTVEEVEGGGAYDAIVLGNPVYDQSWLPEARRIRAGQRRRIGRSAREPKQIGEVRKAVQPREYREQP